MSDTITIDTPAGDDVVVKLLEGDRLIAASKPNAVSFSEDCAEDCDHSEHDGDKDGSSCRRHIVRLPGHGRQKFPMPTDDEVVDACREYIQEVARLQRQRAASSGDKPRKRKSGIKALQQRALRGVERARPAKALRMPGTLKQGLSGIYQRMASPADAAAVNPRKLIPVIEHPVGFRQGDPTLWSTAGGLAEELHDGRFEHHIAEVFDPHIGAIDWARHHLAAKYQPTVESLSEHFRELVGLYRRTLPSVMHSVAAQYPDAHEDQIIDAAVSVINQKLAEILYILSIWTDSFVQQRDGKYRQLLHVIFTLEQSFKLFNPPHAKTQTLHVGDVFMARFGANGPATIPGARGPVGAHAIEVPHDEREIIMIMLCVYLHEFRHDYYADVENLAEEMARAVLEAIDRDDKAGRYKFSKKTIKLGNQEVPTLALLKQIIIQTLSETDADVAGGMLLSGPAFLYSLIATFSAFNCKGLSIFNVNNLLRSRNRFAVSEDNDLVFAPHMPDYPRAYFAAAVLDLLKRKTDTDTTTAPEGDECRRIADQASGDPIPKMVTWVNADPKSKFKFKIEVPFSDLIQLAHTVAGAIMHSKLPCLGGMSTFELVNWNEMRQGKVDRLAAQLMAGKSDIPAGMGDVFATYVAAAAITAYWGLCKAGMRPRLAIARVESAARKMMDIVRERVNEPIPVDPPATSPAPAPTVPTPAPVAPVPPTLPPAGK